jgi:hypothetical protein
MKNKKLKPSTIKKYIRSFLLERSEEGDPVYMHSRSCPSYCDYCCNGNRGFEIAKQIEEWEKQGQIGRLEESHMVKQIEQIGEEALEKDEKFTIGNFVITHKQIKNPIGPFYENYYCGKWLIAQINSSLINESSYIINYFLPGLESTDEYEESYSSLNYAEKTLKEKILGWILNCEIVYPKIKEL